MNGDKTKILLTGCRPEPLASYLKSLALLRLVGEQKDEKACGWWENGCFCLHSSLNEKSLIHFLLYEYAPTPLVAPWNGGSGFFPRDRKNGIEALRDSPHLRFASYRKTILAGERILSELSITNPPSGAAQKEVKNKLLFECRATLPDEALAWTDAAYTLAPGGVQFPPLLGTGGNDGRLEFTNNFMQRLNEMIDASSGHPTLHSESLCRMAIYSDPSANLRKDLPIGQFLPGSAGGANAGPGYDADSLMNPWDFILLLEGSLLFAAAVSKRLQLADPGAMSVPFTVRSSLAGYASAAPKDKARAEIWLPLWEKLARLGEIRTLFSEGRSEVGRRPSRTGVDFARAIATLGVDRGISSFLRMGFIERNGQAYLATPLGHWPVLQRPEVNLIEDIDSWFDRFRGFASGSRVPASFNRCLRRMEAALLGVCKEATANQWQRLIIALGEAERQLTKSPKRTAESRLSPLPRLRPEWLKQADDGSPEFRLAASLASIYDPKIGPLRANMIPMAIGKPYPAFNLDKMDDNSVVWGEGSLTNNLIAVMERRLLEYRQKDSKVLPVRARVSAGLADIRLFIAGAVDEVKLEGLLWGLNAVDWFRVQDDSFSQKTGDPLIPASYALLKLTHVPGPIRFNFDDTGIEVPLDPAVFARAKTGQIASACRIAYRRLRAAGLYAKVNDFLVSGDQSKRVAAAMLFTLRDSEVLYLARMVLKPPAGTGR